MVFPNTFSIPSSTKSVMQTQPETQVVDWGKPQFSQSQLVKHTTPIQIVAQPQP